jgi:hypothetical protein
MTSSFRGNLITSNGSVVGEIGPVSFKVGSAAEQSPQNVTATFSFNPVTGDVSVSGLPQIPPFTTNGDTITVTISGGVTGSYDEIGVMTLTFPITLADSNGWLCPTPQNITLNLSMIGSLTVASFGQDATGALINDKGSFALVGSAPVTACIGPVTASIPIGISFTGVLSPSPIVVPPSSPTTMPYLVGLIVDKGIPLINSAGLNVIITNVETANELEWSRFLSQNPAGGTPLTTGSLVQASVGAPLYKSPGGGEARALRGL